MASETIPTVIHSTREAWLIAATDLLRGHLFKAHLADIPTVRVSVGFPGGGSARKRIGEYWHGAAASDAIPQVYISPVLADPTKVLDVLVHELVHARTPGARHRGPFKRLAVAVGLEGKMTATVAGERLLAHLRSLADQLGTYPHGALFLKDRKRQSTRLVKCECPACGYTARITRKWLDDYGALICPRNALDETVETAPNRLNVCDSTGE